MRERVKPVMTLTELVELPLICMTNASTAMKYMSAALLQKDTQFRPMMQFDQVGTIGGFVRQGVGVAVLPYLGVLPLRSLDSFFVAAISDGPVRSIGIVTRRSEPASAMCSRALAHVRSSAKSLIAQQPAWILPAAR